MRKVKYHFDPVNITFEIVRYPFRKKVRRVLLYLLAAILYGIVVLVIAYSVHDSPKERYLKRELANMEFQFRLLNDRLDKVSKVLEELQYRDDNIYRVIFEAEPVPTSMRRAGIGGAERYSHLDGYMYSQLLTNLNQKLDRITAQLVVQSKSFDEVYEMAKKKTEYLASIPAIMPVSMKDYRTITSYFGYRMDPFYKVIKMHEGVDFSAPVGTKIYAAGDGVVRFVEKGKSHYGNNLLIDHGFGYSTFYAHCHDIKVKPGQRVKRGEVIATVGNTGKSSGPHLHYEVRKNGRPINPIHFFFNDITPEDYQKMIELSNIPSQAMD